MNLSIAIFAFSLILLHSPAAVSQEQTNHAQREKTSPPLLQGAEKNDDQKPLHILYTGRLMGYFREPDWQSPDERICPSFRGKTSPSGEMDESPSARTFDEIFGNQSSTGILVSIGDNFAPELEAREFCLPPVSATSDTQLGKDLFAWDYDENDKKHSYHWELSFNPANPNAYVPKDNVASFLINRGYTAIVPGHHDFYFGPDRLRLLARLLAATHPIDKTSPVATRRPKSVQMLGANIVIETSWKNDHEPLPDTARPPAFVPRFPRGSDLLATSEYDLTLTGLKDGDTVYPWFVGVKVSLKHLPLDLKSNAHRKKSAPAIVGREQQHLLSQLLEKSEPRLCRVPPVLSNADFDNPVNKDEERTFFDPGKCQPLHFVSDSATKPSRDGQSEDRMGDHPADNKSDQPDELNYILDFPWRDAVRNATLLAGERYRLCFSGPPVSISNTSDEYLTRKNIKPNIPSDKSTTIAPSPAHKPAGDTYFCVRFSTYLPLFQSSWGRQTSDNPKDCKKQGDDPADCKEPGQALEDCRVDEKLHNNNKPTLRNPMAMCPTGPENQQDPAPYALVEPGGPDATKDKDAVAIFGVVDPHLADSIGLLNMAWRNRDPRFKTQVAFKDPGEAIKQLLASFNRRYKEDHKDDFAGIMVLLAQMGPPQAQAFSNRIPAFTVVISAADQDGANLATVDNVWTPYVSENGSADKTNPEETRSPAAKDPVFAPHPRYLAVPYPQYVGAQKPRESQWITDIGSLRIFIPQEPDKVWRSRSEHLHQRTSIGALPLQQEQWFSQVLFPTVVDHCISAGQMPADAGGSDNEKRQDQRLSYLQVMTLCAMQKETNADVAMLQKRDIFTDLPNYVDQLPLEKRSSQEILDRIIWKGDFLQLIYVPGSTLKKVLDQSKAFEAEDKSALSLADESNRGLITLGIPFDPDRKEYRINGAALNPNKLYAVATSEFMAMGDTGYPDLASSQANPPLLPMEAGRNGRFKTISSVVCSYLSPRQNCLPEIDGKEYFDLSMSFPDNPRIGETSWQELKLWSVFSHPANVLGSPAVPSPGVQEAAEAVVRNRPFWDFNLAKWSLGLTRLAHTGNNFDVKTLFGGLTSSEPSTVSSTTWTSDFAAAFSHSWAHHLFSISPGYTYNVQHKGQPDDLDQVTQTANRGSLDAAYAYIVEGRQPEHQDIVFTAHFETPLLTAFNSVTLNSTHPGEDGKPIKDQLRFHLDRSYTLLMRPGYRWKRHISSVEFGPEWGHEWKALTGIDFLTGANPPLICSASAGAPLSSCTANALKNNPNAILGTSIVATNRNNQDHTGAYWKINMTVPFTRRISYVLTDAGDFFPVRYATENSTTTLLRDYSQHQLKIDIFSSISIGPEFDALLYRNKAVPGLNGHFLFQDQVLMKAQWSFDLFNWRDKHKQLEYGPPSSK